MFKNTKAFSSFSVNDLDVAKEFYGKTLGVEVKEIPHMGLELHVVGSTPIFVYPKDNHAPATFTILNFQVADVIAAVKALNDHGITCEQYPEMGTDEKGIAHYEDSTIAWFKDPAGNILSVVSESK